MRRALCAAFVVLALTPLISQSAQRPAGKPAGAFQTIRGRVVTDDSNAAPLRRVRVVLTAAGVSASPTYTDRDGRFEIASPRTAAYALTLTKAGFAPREIRRAAASAADLEIRMSRGSAIAGRVIDQFGDAALAQVRIHRVGDGSVRAVQTNDWTGDTDDVGEFRVGSLPAGRYEVSAQAIALVVSTGSDLADARSRSIVDVRSGEDSNVTLVVSIRAADRRGTVIGASATPVVANGATIRGRIVGPDGRGVGGAFVSLTAGVAGAREGESESNGMFEFTGLPAGTYRVTAYKVSASLTMVDDNVSVSVRRQQMVDDLTIPMRRPSVVTGTVIDEYGEPIEGVDVRFLLSARRGGRRLLQPIGIGRQQRTDDRGRYRLPNAPVGEYYVVAGDEAPPGSRIADGVDTSLRIYYPGTPALADAVPVTIAAGRDAFNIDIVYSVLSGARVSGSALDSRGEPLRFPVSLVESARAGRPVSARREARVGEDGTFTFANVAPGDYVVHGLRRAAPGRESELGVEWVHVGDTDQPGVILRTSPGTLLRGRVELEGDTSAVSFDAFGVGAMPSDPDYSVLGIDAPGIGIGEDGAFELRVQGPMRLWPTIVPDGWWLKSAMIDAIDAADDPYPFAARGDAVVDVRVVFANSAAEISGTVVDDRNQPMPNSFALIFSTDASRIYRSSRYVKVAPAAEATFRAASLPPGDYWLVGVRRLDPTTDYADPEVLNPLTARAQRLTVAEGQRIVRNAPLVATDR